MNNDDKYLYALFTSGGIVMVLFVFFLGLFINLLFFNFKTGRAVLELLEENYIFKPADEKRYCAKCKNEIKYSKFESPYCFVKFKLERDYYLVECEHCKTRTLVHARSPLEAVDTVGILPKEKVIKPFETIKEARVIITAHGGFIKDKNNGAIYLVIGYTGNDDAKPEVYIADDWYSLEHIAKNFVFLDDNSPCGGYQIKKF